MASVARKARVRGEGKEEKEEEVEEEECVAEATWRVSAMMGAWWLARGGRRWGVCRQAGITLCWELLRSTAMPLLLL